MKVNEIELDKIVQIDNLRAKNEDLADLMSSFRSAGLLQPIGVCGNEKEGYAVLWGNRRLAAAKKLGWKTIPAILAQEKDITEEQAIVINLVENEHRTQNTVFDLGRGCAALKKIGLNEHEISSRLSIPLSRIKGAMQDYLNIPEKMRPNVKSLISSRDKREKGGKISQITAHNILRFKSEFGLSKDEVNKLFEEVRKKEISVEELRIVSRLISMGASAKRAVEDYKKYRVVRTTLVFDKVEFDNIKKSKKNFTSVSFLSDCVETATKNTRLVFRVDKR